MTTTPWYYDYYELGAFPHQQQLCDAVRWSGCNLEGQRVVPTTLIHMSSNGTEKEYRTKALTGETANPLTIRLLAIREALNQLESSANPISEAIKRQAERQFDKNKFFVMVRTFKAQDSSTETGGAPVEIIEISGKRKPVEFHYDMVHLALYEFFTNFGSVMDRLAYEINLLYGLQINKVDWPKLVDTKLGKDKYWKALNNKDTELARLIKDCTPKFIKALDYRNRLMHDGIIRVEVNISVLGLSIMLAGEPSNDGSAMNVDAISFCKKTKADVLELLDGSYQLMFLHLQSHGDPPW